MSKSFVSKLIAVTAALAPINSIAQDDRFAVERSLAAMSEGTKVTDKKIEQSIAARNAFSPAVKAVLSQPGETFLDNGTVTFLYVRRNLSPALLQSIKDETGATIVQKEARISVDSNRTIPYVRISMPLAELNKKLEAAPKAIAPAGEKLKLSAVSEALLKRGEVFVENGIATFVYRGYTRTMDPRVKDTIEKELGVIVEEREFDLDDKKGTDVYRADISIPLEILKQYSNIPSLETQKGKTR